MTGSPPHSPAAVSPSCSIAASSSAPAVLPSASSRSFLDRDALGSVLGFLSLRELASALSVAKEWHVAALQSMHPAMLTVGIFSDALGSLLASPALRRHVGQIDQTMVPPDGSKLWLSPSHLPALARALPQLRSLTAFLRMVQVADREPLLLPARLQWLDMRVLHLSLDPQEIAADFLEILTSTSQLPQLHTLRLELAEWEGPAPLTLLQRLPLLRDLELKVEFQQDTERFAVDLRALSGLHRLRVAGQWKTTSEDCAALFIALLRDAPEEQLQALQWRDFFLDGLDFTDELTSLLPRLPSLERLRANLMRCTCFEFLSALPRLTSLELDLSWMTDDAWRNLLAFFTSDGLARLRTLALHGGPFSDDDLVQLLSHTPSLTSLSLHELGCRVSSPTLSFFLQLPKLIQTLTHLTLECTDWWRLTATDLPPLVELQQLRTLRLLHWPSKEPDGLTTADRAPFEQRPCAVLPHLEVFEWTTR